ncbi:MAG: ATP-dependent zinc metalloprotease FtsH, partial [Solirubrobacteraceae bacterium]
APSSAPGGTPPRRSRLWRRYAIVALALLAVNWLVAGALYKGPEPTTIAYSPLFLQQARAGNVQEISSTDTGAIQGVFKTAVHVAGDDQPITDFRTQVPSFADDRALSAALAKGDVTVNASPPDSGPGLIASLLVGFGPVLLLIAAFVWLSRRAGAMMGAGPLGAFSRSRARRVEGEATRTTFADVAGIDDAKDELAEIVDYLRRPEHYRRLGGRVPRGVLLSGAPGTGKTLLARAVAGEAAVPFFSMSASEFVEMIVGVGASRVRDLFAEAKSAAPAIVFIDELDAIGRARTAGTLPGGNDEREQTLNQILTEMDGFDAGTGVVVLAATNRAEILDGALLRPGRFDRRIAVQPPDIAGRRQILAVHTRSLPLAPDVDLDALAAATPGMVGADLANLANEAALLATRRDHESVEDRDFSDALERLLLGAERRLVLSPDDRRRTAYHEAGHALVGMLTPEADPVRKVSIIPRGPALGVTHAAPDADRFNYDERELLAKIRVAIAGRAAEELVFGDLTTGAESDIQQLTGLAHAMVARWGMSRELGPVALPADDIGAAVPAHATAVSESTHRTIDREVRRIVQGARDDALRLLREQRGRLERLAQALLEQETLDQEAAYRAAGLDPPGPPAFRLVA